MNPQGLHKHTVLPIVFLHTKFFLNVEGQIPSTEIRIFPRWYPTALKDYTHKKRNEQDKQKPLQKLIISTQSTQVYLLHFASTLFYISKTPPSSCWHIYVQNRLLVMPATKHSMKIQTLKPEMKAKMSTSLHKFKRQF